MMSRALFLGLLAISLAPEAANAQLISNAPISIGASTAVGGGMSLAYRQAYLNQRLDNSRPRALVRGADGFLLDVQRGPSRQAFVRAPVSPFLPGVAVGTGQTDLALGIGGLGFALGPSYSLPAQPVGYPPAPRSSSPIDSWIAMLDGNNPSR